jgi:hypothetical protein
MEQSPTSSPTQCLNCGATVAGAYCHQCGQRTRDNSDRSIGRLLGEVLGNIFFLDNRFLLSMWYLLRYPGRMSVEFLEGKRKKFISPVTLFLFFNLIYFFVNPLSDYSLPLYDQISSQPYSDWTKEQVRQKLREEALEFKDYAVTYQNASDNISKSVMIINIPMIAAFIYLLSFKRRRFYFDSLIFAFHFFSLFMLSWVMLDWVETLVIFLFGEDSSIVSTIRFNLFLLIIPLLYGFFSIKKFLQIPWYWGIPGGIGAVFAVLFTNLFYRFIIFVITLWMT